MKSVCIIDTSIFLNLLNVPGRNQKNESVKKDFQEFIDLEVTFILPMTTIIETGNHIAQNGDGNTRRQTARRFCDTVNDAFKGDTPFQPTEFPDKTEISSWINDFPEYAGRNKSRKKHLEGTSFGDLSIIKEYEKCVSRFSRREVFIWSLDEDLQLSHQGT